MLLETSATPIRIRIVSGGEEHSSLESLRNNFSLKDVLPTVKDGRLAKWLRQKGEYTLAESVAAFKIRSDMSKPVEGELLKFLYLFFPTYKNRSLLEIVYTWQKVKGYEKNYCHIISYATRLLPLDVILKGYNEARERLSENEWRCLAINFLRQVPLQKAISVYRDGLLATLLKDDDWYEAFTNRADCKDSLTFYSVWEVLSKIPKYEAVAFKYLKRSAELGFPRAMFCIRKKEDENLINIFLNNPYIFSRDSEKGNDLKQLLKILGMSIETNTCPAGEVGHYSKYLKVCAAVYKWKYWYGVGPTTCIRALRDECNAHTNFIAAERLIQFISEDIKIGGRKFSSLDYCDCVKFIVQLLKEYEL